MEVTAREIFLRCLLPHANVKKKRRSPVALELVFALTGDLDRRLLVEFPGRLVHVADDEEDDGQGCADQRDNHQHLEPVDQALQTRNDRYQTRQTKSSRYQTQKTGIVQEITCIRPDKPAVPKITGIRQENPVSHQIRSIRLDNSYQKQQESKDHSTYHILQPLGT